MGKYSNVYLEDAVKNLVLKDQNFKRISRMDVTEGQGPGFMLRSLVFESEDENISVEAFITLEKKTLRPVKVRYNVETVTVELKSPETDLTGIQKFAHEHGVNVEPSIAHYISPAHASFVFSLTDVFTQYTKERLEKSADRIKGMIEAAQLVNVLNVKDEKIGACSTS